MTSTSRESITVRAPTVRAIFGTFPSTTALYIVSIIANEGRRRSTAAAPVVELLRRLVLAAWWVRASLGVSKQFGVALLALVSLPLLYY